MGTGGTPKGCTDRSRWLASEASVTTGNVISQLLASRPGCKGFGVDTRGCAASRLNPWLPRKIPRKIPQNRGDYPSDTRLPFLTAVVSELCMFNDQRNRWRFVISVGMGDSLSLTTQPSRGYEELKFR